MKKYFNILRKCPLFNSIDDNELFIMLDCLGGKIKSYKKKETIIFEGEKPTEIGIILKGTAQIMQVDYYGNRHILSLLETSDMFGESYACLNNNTIPLNIIASEDCEVLLIKAERILFPCENACGFHKNLIYNLVQILAQKNINFMGKIEATSKRTTREKLLAYLNLISKKTGKQKFAIPFSRQELADYLVVDRSGLSNEISKLKKEKIINNRKNVFELLK